MSVEERIQAMMDRVDDDIDRLGWSAIGVFAAVDDPEGMLENPFTYTIGLLKTYEHPELIVYGLPPEQAHSILASAIEQIKEGVHFSTGRRYSKVLGGGFEVEFRKVDPTGRPLNVARNYYEADVEALQLVWPDKEGRFPGEAGVDPTFANCQEPEVES